MSGLWLGSWDIVREGDRRLFTYSSSYGRIWCQALELLGGLLRHLGLKVRCPLARPTPREHTHNGLIKEVKENAEGLKPQTRTVLHEPDKGAAVITIYWQITHE